MYGNIINEAFGKVTAKSLNVFITQIKCNAYAVLQISMKRLSLIFGCKKGCKSRNYLIYTLYCGETGILPYHATTYHGLLPPWWKHIGQRFLYRQQHEQSFGTRLYREHTEIQFWRKHGRKNIRHYLRCQHPFYNSLHRE